MARSELGNKYTCQVCSMKFYDLNRELSMCPCCDVKIADAIGISSSQIGKLMFIQKTDPHYIDLIDDGILTVNQSYLTI